MLNKVIYDIILRMRESDLVDNKKINDKIIQEKIRKVDGAMAQEGTPLTKDIKKRLYNCIIGKSTTEMERKKIIEKYRGIYG